MEKEREEEKSIFWLIRWTKRIKIKNEKQRKRLNYVKPSSAFLMIITSTMATTYNDIA